MSARRAVRSGRTLAHFALLALLCDAALALPFPVHAAARPSIGDPVPRFVFKDIRALTRSLDDFGERRAFVLVFTTTTCPLVQRYLPRLNELARVHATNNVQFLAINVGPDDSIPDVALQGLEFDGAFPMAKDFTGDCARAVGATRTPEAVILDTKRRLRYRGRIDDQFRLGGSKPAVGREDLARALVEVCEGHDVSVPETTVDGCAISFPAPIQGDPSLTYAEHVAPILERHCVECHRPGTEAPFALTRYDKVAAKATMIAEVIEDGRMPPWFAHPDHGHFINARGLTPEERRTLRAWAAGPRAAGDLDRLPPPRQWPDTKWRIGQPDLVIPALTREQLPATGYIDYRYLILPYAFTNETWVQGIQIQPSNPRVLHHANLAAVPVGGKFNVDRHFLTGRVPGGNDVNLTNGAALLIPKGSVLAVQAHYVTTGKPEEDRISVGLRYARETVQKQVHNKLIANYSFRIPPHAGAHPVSATRELECDATGIALFTHLHLRGKDSAFIAHAPDGSSEKLLVLPNYNFGWQLAYLWPPNTQHFPKGTKLECLSHFDNSAFNPYNPDPEKTVRNGPQTHDEMMQGFFFYTDDAEHLDLQIDPKTGWAVNHSGGEAQ